MGFKMVKSVLREQFSEFFYYLENEDADIDLSYSPIDREFGIGCTGGGSSVIIIQYCPWSGKAFPKPLRDEWFDQLLNMGIEEPFDQMYNIGGPFEKEFPKDFLTEEWWIKQKL